MNRKDSPNKTGTLYEVLVMIVQCILQPTCKNRLITKDDARMRSHVSLLTYLRRIGSVAKPVAIRI
jgi:hypothetical protein